MVLTLGVGCYLHIVSTGFLRTFKLDVGIAVPRFNVYLSALMGQAGQEVNIMKRLISLLFLVFVAFASYGQDVREVTRFLGIPVDGTKQEMVQKLEEKGFISVPGADMLEGEFNGNDVYVNVQTNNRKVWRIGVMNKDKCDETQIKINFNILCNQFKNNSKYFGFGDQTIPESEDIRYEMAIHNKRYEAMFYQKSSSDSNEEDNMLNRMVWFMISENYGEYRIFLYYENLYNKANGEDL